jgi:ribosome-associated protein
MTASPRAVELVIAAAEAAAEKLGRHTQAFDVSDRLAITDAFLLTSGSNDRQVRSIVDAVEERLRLLDAKPIRREGQQENRWVLLDYGEVVVHVQHAEERTYYSLDRLWKDCPELSLPLADGSGRLDGDGEDDIDLREGSAAAGGS